MIDGWLARAPMAGLDAVWLVKGYEHPEWGYVAVPYRIGGSRLGLGEAFSLACQYGYCRRLDCMPRRVPVLPAGHIVQAVDPEEALRARLRDLPPQARELVEILGPGGLGLTGSWAIMGEGPESDVDLVAYNPGVYGALEDLAEEGLIRDCPRLLERDGRRGVRRAGRRLLDSCYRGVPYTLRILRERGPLPCRCRRTSIGQVEGVLVVVGGEGHLTPARYQAIAPGLGRVVLESWRTRYHELQPGVYRVRGLAFEDECLGYTVISPDIGGGLEPARGHGDL